jgi:hypothetical protein
MCYGRHACFMGVVKGLKALAAIPVDRRSAAVQRTIDGGVEFLLQHILYKRSHDLSRVAKPGWSRFGFPRMYQTDVLEIALLLLRLGCRDERMQEAVALVRSRGGPDGRWALQDTFNGRFQVDVEQMGDLRLAGIERDVRKRYGGRVPEELLLVTPASIAADSNLARVFETSQRGIPRSAPRTP